MAHVPSATRETVSCVSGMSTNSFSTLLIWVCVEGDMMCWLLIDFVN
jgi:hypothetical protein